MCGVSFTGMVNGMLVRIQILVGIFMGALKLGGPNSPSPGSSTTDDIEMLILARPPPELNDDATTEILLHLPSDEPAYLVRASLVCKSWCRIISDPAFSHRYRKFHRTPPLLGFFYNNSCISRTKCAPYFTATTTTDIHCSLQMFASKDWWILDSRHGRVLVESHGQIIVWDPITNRLQLLPTPSYPRCWEPITSAVLCAQAECDHLDCNNGSFLIVSIGYNYKNNCIWARVYSSMTNAWSTMATTIISHFFFIDNKPSLLVRDALYFSIENGRRILKYDLGRPGLSIINTPGEARGAIVVSDDGQLGSARVDGYTLYLWSRRVGIGGIAKWVLRRVIDLKTLLEIPDQFVIIHVIGFAEAAGTIFINTDYGIFTLEPNSEAVRNVGARGPFHAHVVLPYTSFYTPGCRLNHEEAVTNNGHDLAITGSPTERVI